MRQKAVPGKKPADDMVRDIRRARRRNFSAEEKFRIVSGVNTFEIKQAG